jgi:hypothetical protein
MHKPEQIKAGNKTVLPLLETMAGSLGYITYPCSFRDKWKQGNNPGLLDSRRQCPLVFRTGTGDSPGQNLSPLGYKAAQCIRVLIIYLEFLNTESAHLLFKESLATFPTAHPVIAVPSFHLTVPPVTPERPLVFCIFFIRHDILLLAPQHRGAYNRMPNYVWHILLPAPV